MSSSMHGIKIARSAPTISHHLFAEDNIVFSRANAQEAECVKTIMQTYEQASGQVVNLDKSMLSVSRNVPENCFHELTQLLGVKAVESFDKYLGLPTIIGYRTSHAWSSILKAGARIEGGLRWRVGDGSHINLLQDQWLPDGSSLVYMHEAIAELRLEKVADLMDNERWNSELLEESGYKFIRDMVLREEASSSSRPLLHVNQWRKFWASPALPRCKAWRAVQGFLPVRGALAKRGMQLDPCCIFCESKVETSEHSFLKCPAVKRIWFASDMAIRMDNFSSMYDFMVVVLHEDEPDFSTDVHVLLYATWEARNSLIFKGRRLDVVEVVRRASMTNPRVAGNENQKMEEATRTTTWKRPAVGVIKVNVNASIKDGVCGYGMVARDSNGKVLGAATFYPVNAISPLLGEASSLRSAVQLAVEFGFRSVCFETDCLQLFRWWKKGTSGLSYLDAFVHDCPSLLPAFSFFDFIFVRRSGNYVADFLARNASDFPNSIWVEEVPHVVDHLVVTDVLASSPSLI
ncbi:uncharacterized protein LOC130713161 [Lotus japonicus]|uniref:uncharacterized protein LOC130713161 n=1 Tax=Lotus japonicus TaxID=34305 RepID=UPI00258E6F3C|nr:uncharacterized protein LOC130713161 [Lotus japonicus]